MTSHIIYRQSVIWKLLPDRLTLREENGGAGNALLQQWRNQQAFAPHELRRQIPRVLLGWIVEEHCTGHRSACAFLYGMYRTIIFLIWQLRVRFPVCIGLHIVGCGRGQNGGYSQSWARIPRYLAQSVHSVRF